MGAAHATWLEQELSSGSHAKHMLVFAHVPLFLERSHEPAGYFNIDPDLRQHLLNLFSQYRVRTVFCGHYHRNTGGVYTSDDGHTLEVVVTGSVGGNVTMNYEGDPRNLSGMGGLTI